MRANRHKPAKPIADNNGFVTHLSWIDSEQCSGLTKYEEALLRIMAGICANPNYAPDEDLHYEEAAKDAIKQARALMNKAGW